MHFLTENNIQQADRRHLLLIHYLRIDFSSMDAGVAQ